MTAREDPLAGEIYRNLSEEIKIGPDHPFYVRIWEDSDIDPV